MKTQVVSYVTASFSLEYIGIETKKTSLKWYTDKLILSDLIYLSKIYLFHTREFSFSRHLFHTYPIRRSYIRKLNFIFLWFPIFSSSDLPCLFASVNCSGSKILASTHYFFWECTASIRFIVRVPSHYCGKLRGGRGNWNFQMCSAFPK